MTCTWVAIQQIQLSTCAPLLPTSTAGIRQKTSEKTWAVRLIRDESETDGSHRRSHQNTAHMHKHHHHHHHPPPPHTRAPTPAHENTERRSPSHPLFRIMFYMTLERHQRLFLHLARTFSTQSKWLLHIH